MPALLAQDANREADDCAGCDGGQDRIIAAAVVDPLMTARRIVETIAAIIANDHRVGAVVITVTNRIARVVVAAVVMINDARARAIIGRRTVIVARYDPAAIVVAVVVTIVIAAAAIVAPLVAAVMVVAASVTAMVATIAAITITMIAVAAITPVIMSAVTALVGSCDGCERHKRESSCGTDTEK